MATWFLAVCRKGSEAGRRGYRRVSEKEGATLLQRQTLLLLTWHKSTMVAAAWPGT
jgi:hypothetical protein